MVKTKPSCVVLIYCVTHVRTDRSSLNLAQNPRVRHGADAMRSDSRLRRLRDHSNTASFLDDLFPTCSQQHFTVLRAAPCSSKCAISCHYAAFRILLNNKFSSSALTWLLDILVGLYLVNYDYRSRVYWELSPFWVATPQYTCLLASPLIFRRN